MDDLRKIIDERLLHDEELWMKEREVKAIRQIEKRLTESEMQTGEEMATNGIALDASLVTKERKFDNTTLSEQENKSSSLGYDTNAEMIPVDMVASDIKNDDIRPSYDANIEVHHSNNDTFETIFDNKIQSHEQLNSISYTYVVNENNSNIISDIPDMDPKIDKEEYDYADDEQ
nr:hypothetical protein [Tanacetum cinerariifolium]